MIDYEIELDFLDNEIVDASEQQEEYVLRECAQTCMDKEQSCSEEGCKHWIKFESDNNCDLISIKKYGPLTLRQVGERMGVSYVRIKQIEDVAIKKIRKTTSLDNLKD
jgi:DNA-directed RNA polymerase specialized sigma subunit